jgi:glycosyltransferase involved in cell wall biosynthesis
MKLSVIVPAFNEEKLLGTTLACIREATRDLAVELIVCDAITTVPRKLQPKQAPGSCSNR